MKTTIYRLFLPCLLLCFTNPLHARMIVEWDFTQGAHRWSGNPTVVPVRSTSDGLVVRSTGLDPWIEGPAVDIPEGSLVRLTLRVRTSADGSGQIFYGRSFAAERVRSLVLFNDDQWHDYAVMIGDSMGKGTRFRFDPSHGGGLTVVRFIRVEALDKPDLPVFKPPQKKTRLSPSVALEAGPIALAHACDTWGNFTIRFSDRDMASGYTGEMIGIQFDDKTEWLALGKAKVSVRLQEQERLTEEVALTDSQGAIWRISRTLTPLRRDEEWTFLFQTSITVNQDRDVVYLPWITLLPGFGSFGSQKHQAVFSGLEYLADEPSSSEADITGPEHIRRIPDPVKITFPLMAIEQAGCYVGLIWEKSDLAAVGFDSPDTVFGSGAHAMWLSGPGIGNHRFPNDASAHSPIRLQANQSITVQGWIIAGRGDSMVPAVQQYVRLRGLPEVPVFEGGFTRAVELLAHGWLDSAANRDWRFRHAVWGDSFGPTPAADAALFMHWLARSTRDQALAERLKDGVKKTLEQLSPGDPFSSSVSHVSPPVAPLVFGRVDEYVRMRQRQALAHVQQFDAQGKILYKPGKDRPDYAKTHFADHANGLGGRIVADILESAALCGDSKLIEEGLALLDKQTLLYANTVPRGAQTWEMPLHTPDILASAYMIRAYVYGYLHSGNREYLEQARYWAWTGVPFIYLANPTDGPVGPYATIAVLGATNWVAPVWFGQPVQWCGLVYGSALHLLADYDDSGPWRQLARGITIAGLQMTWPESDKDRQGLLPDFFHLRQQISDGPAINPGTVGAHSPEAFGKHPLYTMKKLSTQPWFLHAPCRITDIREKADNIVFTLDGMYDAAYTLLVSGLDSAPPQIQYAEKSTPKAIDSFTYDESGFLTIPLQGKCTVRINLK
ncbi:MAG: hypothetical protein JW828_02480 [Sedimentisphaerales bacterium]|nr:hypothetical protein [Sedimentisphaerales bacterium]